MFLFSYLHILNARKFLETDGLGVTLTCDSVQADDFYCTRVESRNTPIQWQLAREQAELVYIVDLVS